MNPTEQFGEIVPNTGSSAAAPDRTGAPLPYVVPVKAERSGCFGHPFAAAGRALADSHGAQSTTPTAAAASSTAAPPAMRATTQPRLRRPSGASAAWAPDRRPPVGGSSSRLGSHSLRPSA